MSWLDDLATLCEEAGILRESVRLSSKGMASGAVAEGPFISIIETGGTTPDYTHNKKGIAYENPSAQLLCRGEHYEECCGLLRLAFDRIVEVENEFVNSTWYLYIHALQSTFIDLGADENGRARVAFNVLGKKRPS
jgi:hypothetical protein